MFGLINGLLIFGKVDDFEFKTALIQIIYCLVFWTFYAILFFGANKLVGNHDSFYNVLSLTIQIFSIAYVVNHFLILLISPISFQVGDFQSEVFDRDIYLFYFPLKLIFLTVYMNWAFTLINRRNKKKLWKILLHNLLITLVIIIIVTIDFFFFLESEFQVTTLNVI